MAEIWPHTLQHTLSDVRVIYSSIFYIMLGDCPTILIHSYPITADAKVTNLAENSSYINSILISNLFN